MYLRSSWIHLACVGVAPLQLVTLPVEGGATPMQAKWNKLDLGISDGDLLRP